MQQWYIIILCLLISSSIAAQQQVTVRVQNSKGEALAGASVQAGAEQAIADQQGSATLTVTDTLSWQLTVTQTGYQPWQALASGGRLLVILQPREEALEEITVVSFRTNSRIEDLPTKVEVLGAEEVGEETGIKPGNIASLLGDVAGIQIQQTNAATGNADARVQGLPGRYTQLLRDGIPLFGGYAGSFGILQIPPADLQQIEIVKGASSTLYGGGAIAGMINLVSKSPRLNRPETIITLNQSSLKESNASVFLSRRYKHVGYTLFTGLTRQQAVDVNKDGLSDVPFLRTSFFNPAVFFYPDSSQRLILRYNLTHENRQGGDMQVLAGNTDAVHQFFIRNRMLRQSLIADYEKRWQQRRLNVKAAVNSFGRNISTSEFGMRARQWSWFSEASIQQQLTHHLVVAGINVNGEKYRTRQPDSSQLQRYQYTTVGLFLQDDWKLNRFITAQAGVRYDHHNVYGNMLLPRLSVLYKISASVSTRLGGGLGYKTPQWFANEIDERNYGKVTNNNAVQAERSAGLNWDVNFHHRFSEWELTVNQLFYFTQIDHPLLGINNGSSIRLFNAAEPIQTKGTETYIAAREDELELYLGYTYTYARQLYDAIRPNVPLSARHKLAAVIANEFSDHFRAGIEAAYTGRQYLSDGSSVNGWFFAAAMMRYDWHKLSFVLNCENLFDYRQSSKMAVYTGSISNPVFKEIWAPLDGRVINLSATLRL